MSLDCRRFRPIRRDSDSAESQSSASLAGSAPDADVVVPARLPPRSAGAPHVVHAAVCAAPRHRRLKPAWSSNGSASSYDNLDEPSTSTPPRHAHLQPWLPQPRSLRLVRPVAAKVAGSGTDEALDEPGERLTSGAPPSSVDVSSGSTSVWRRPTLDGHFQVVPPTMIGVFDPTAQLSKFARQTSTRKTSVNLQRNRGNTAKVPETVPKEMILFDGVRLLNRIRDSTAVSVRESPPRTLAQNSQPLEYTTATAFKSYSPCGEPHGVAASEIPEISETVGELKEPPADDGRQNSTSAPSSASSSSSSTDDDDEDVAECVNDDDTGAEDHFPAVDSERNPTRTTSASGTQSSTNASPAAVDVSGQEAERAATFDEQSAAALSVSPSREDVVTGDQRTDSPLSLPGSARSASVNEVSVQVNVQQPEDVKNEDSSTSSQSKSSVSSCDEQDGDFDQQLPELRISSTDRGTAPSMYISFNFKSMHGNVNAEQMFTISYLRISTAPLSL